MGKRISNTRIVLAFILTFILMALISFWAINTGGLKTGISQLMKGLFVNYDETVAIIFELRFPRIVIALVGGGMMAVAGVLMQAVMKNPLADPGILGITSGAAFAAVILTAFAPTLAKATSVFAFLGGVVAFFVVYMLSWNGQIRPMRLILVGIAVDAVFTGLTNAFSAATGGTYSTAASIINSNISLKTWEEAYRLLFYFIITILLCVLLSGRCNLLLLSDQTMHSLGIEVDKTRLMVSLLAVFMASIFTSIVGSVSFLGLIVPHIARLIVGSNHRVLIPYSASLGAVLFLLADTFGRSIAYPYEISATIVMAIIGGPMFIVLLKKSRGVYE